MLLCQSTFHTQEGAAREAGAVPGSSPPQPPLHLLGLERMLASSSLELSRRMSLEGRVSSNGNRLM